MKQAVERGGDGRVQEKVSQAGLRLVGLMRERAARGMRKVGEERRILICISEGNVL